MLFQYECSMRGKDTCPVSARPLFGRSEIFSFAKVKIITTDYKFRASNVIQVYLEKLINQSDYARTTLWSNFKWESKPWLYGFRHICSHSHKEQQITAYHLAHRFLLTPRCHSKTQFEKNAYTVGN